MTKAETEILKSALLYLGREELNSYKNLKNEENELSLSLESKIKEINKKRKTFLNRILKTTWGKVATIFIASILTISLATGIYAIRKPIVGFFVSISEKFIYFSHEENTDTSLPTEIKNIALPSVLPDGYIMISSKNYGQSATSMWMKGSSYIVLMQDVIVDTNVNLDNEGVEYQRTIVNGMDVYHYVKDGVIFLIWTDNFYLYSMIFPQEIEIDDIKEIVSSIK